LIRKYLIDLNWTEAGFLIDFLYFFSIGAILYNAPASYDSNKETNYILVQFRFWIITTNLELGVQI